jgi:hypothetical protein
LVRSTSIKLIASAFLAGKDVPEPDRPDIADAINFIDVDLTKKLIDKYKVKCF